MRNLFLLISVFFIFSCKEVSKAQIKYEKLVHKKNKDNYDIYDLYFTSDINLDSLGKTEKRNFFLFCPLDDTIDFTMKNMNKTKYYIRGGEVKKDITQYVVENISFNENINNFSREKRIVKVKVKELLSGKECISCKIYDGGYLFKAPYYSEPFCIPVKDIIKILDDSIK